MPGSLVGTNPFGWCVHTVNKDPIVGITALIYECIAGSKVSSCDEQIKLRALLDRVSLKKKKKKKKHRSLDSQQQQRKIFHGISN